MLCPFLAFPVARRTARLSPTHTHMGDSGPDVVMQSVCGGGQDLGKKRLIEGKGPLEKSE